MGIGVGAADGLAAAARRHVAAVERVQQVVELARPRLDDAPLHVPGHHRRVVRQQIAVDRHDGLDGARAHLRLGGAAERVQPVGDVLVAQLDDVVLEGVQHVVVDLGPRPEVEAEVLDDPEVGRLLPDLVRVRLGEQLVLVDAAVVVVDALAERGELGQQPALHERRHHVVDERRHAASPRHQALADDVDVVDVEVGQVADERVRGVGLGEPDVLAVEPLQGAVRAEVDDRVGAEPHRLRGAQPRVGRHVLVVRREVVGVVQVLLVLAPAARRLREHHDVAVAQGGNDEAAVARHEGRVLGAAPVGDDLLAQLGRVVVQPLQVVAHPRARRAAVRQQLVELAGGVAAHVARAGRDALRGARRPTGPRRPSRGGSRRPACA